MKTKMETIPAKVTAKLVDDVDNLVNEGWFASRSEAIRDAIRDLVQKMKVEQLEKVIREDIEWGLKGS